MITHYVRLGVGMLGYSLIFKVECRQLYDNSH